jgi:large subunit ribosomal protein L29
MKMIDIKNKSVDALTSELAELKQKLYEMKSQATSDKLEDVTRIGKIKKDIARLNTGIRQQELAKK